MVDAEKDKKESKEGDEKKKVQKELKVLSTGKAEAGKGRKKCDAKPDVFESSKRKSLEQSEKADLGDLDDIFAKKPKKASWEVGKGPVWTKGPDMAEIKAEEEKYKGAKNAGGRNIVDGVPVYSMAELEAEMGDDAWDAFMDAAEPGLS